jgi:hypothetical protein
MPTKLIRAIVRGIDTAPRTTDWLWFGSPDIHTALIAILPPAGEDFIVVWETCETFNQAA